MLSTLLYYIVVLLSLVAKSFVCRATCSRKLNLSQPSTCRVSLLCQPSLYYLYIATLLLHIIFAYMFCVDWWGIHQCPPSINLFLLIETHYLGSGPRNQLVPWDFQISVESFLTIKNRFTSLAHVGQFHGCSTLAHSFTLIRLYLVPWGPYYSLVGPLTSVNNICQLLVIRWILPCSTSEHLLTLVGIIPLGLWWRP